MKKILSYELQLLLRLQSFQLKEMQRKLSTVNVFDLRETLNIIIIVFPRTTVRRDICTLHLSYTIAVCCARDFLVYYNVSIQD